MISANMSNSQLSFQQTNKNNEKKGNEVLRLKKTKASAPSLLPVTYEEVQKHIMTMSSTEDNNDEDIQDHFQKLILKQIEQKNHRRHKSDMEEKVDGPQMKNMQKKITSLIKDAKKRIGFKRRDKETLFLKNMEKFKDLNTYFDVSSLMKSATDETQNFQCSSIKEAGGKKRMTISQPPQVSSFKTGPEDSNSELNKFKQSSSKGMLQRTLAEHALKTAKEKSKMISSMKNYNSQIPLSLQGSNNKKGRSTTVSRKASYFSLNDSSVYEEFDPQRNVEEREAIQKAIKEIDLGLEEYKKMSLDSQKTQLFDSLIECLELFRENQSTEKFILDEFDDEMQAKFYKLLEERLRKVLLEVEPGMLDAVDKKDFEEYLEKMKNKMTNGLHKEKLDTDVKLAEDLANYKMRSEKVMKLLKTTTNRILKQQMQKSIDASVKFFDNKKKAQDSRLVHQQDNFDSYLMRSKGKLTLTTLFNSKTSSAVDFAEDAQKKILRKLPKTPLRIQIHPPTLLPNSDTPNETTLLEQTVTPTQENLTIDSNQKKETHETLKTSFFEGSEFLNPPSLLPSLAKIVIGKEEKVQQMSPTLEGKHHEIDRSYQHSLSPPKNQKTKSKVFSRSACLSSPQLNSMINLDVSNVGKKFMRYNDKLIEIAKKSENVQKAMQRQMKRIDYQNDKLGNFYGKKFREYQVKLENLPTNLFKEKTHDRLNQNKRQEFANRISKNLLHAIQDI